MALQKEDVATKAFMLIGGVPVSSFTADTSRESDIAENLYENLVRGELTSYDWSFCQYLKIMSRDSDTPATIWDAQYSIPSEIILMRAVLVEEQPIKYEIHENKVFCDASVDDQVFAKGLIRAQEEIWPDYFTLAMVYRLAANFAGALARDGALITAFEEKAVFQFRNARKADAGADTNKAFRTTRLLSTRR